MLVIGLLFGYAATACHRGNFDAYSALSALPYWLYPIGMLGLLIDPIWLLVSLIGMIIADLLLSRVRRSTWMGVLLVASLIAAAVIAVFGGSSIAIHSSCPRL